jgi:hypothetical protein
MGELEAGQAPVGGGPALGESDRPLTAKALPSAAYSTTNASRTRIVATYVQRENFRVISCYALLVPPQGTNQDFTSPALNRGAFLSPG